MVEPSRPISLSGRRAFHPHLDAVCPHGPGFRPMGWSCGGVVLSSCDARALLRASRHSAASGAAWATDPGGTRL